MRAIPTTIHGRRPAPTVARAFTLIELLVVVAILALLVAILLPSLRAARAQARRTKCLTNAAQLCKACAYYLEDSRGAFLQGINVDFNFGGQQGTNQFPWPGQPTDAISKPLNRFTSAELVSGRVIRDGGGNVVGRQPSAATAVYSCPADEGAGPVQPTAYEYYGSSYVTNPMLIGQSALNVNGFPPVLQPIIESINRRLRKLNIDRVTTNHTKLVLLGDIGWRFAWLNLQLSDERRFAEWHERRLCHATGFLDGRAAFVHMKRGQQVTADYTIIPFQDLAQDADAVEPESPDE